jgi:hypothetical protein
MAIPQPIPIPGIGFFGPPIRRTLREPKRRSAKTRRGRSEPLATQPSDLKREKGFFNPQFPGRVRSASTHRSQLHNFLFYYLRIFATNDINFARIPTIEAVKWYTRA